MVRNPICSTLISAITGMIATKSTYESDIYEINDRPLEINSTSKRFLIKTTIGMPSDDSFLRSGFHFANRADVTDG